LNALLINSENAGRIPYHTRKRPYKEWITVMRTYKFRLKPTKEQIEKMEWTLGMCRWLYNSMLEQRKFSYKRRGITLNYHKQAVELPKIKKEIPELKEIHSQVFQDVAKQLDKAFQAFFRRVKLGEKPGYPRFQGKNRYDSFTYLKLATWMEST